jgi:Uncharacterised nucleotidyltransferase
MSGEDQEMLDTLKRAAVALKESGIPFALGGSFAVYARGGPCPEHDVDFVLLPGDADKALSVLGAHGFRSEEAPEDWLVKVYEEDRLVDLIFRVAGREVTREMLDRAETLEVNSVAMPVLDATDIIVSLLNSFSHHHCDFGAVLPKARAMREQVDWEQVREQTAESDFAYAFLVLAERLGIVPPARAAGAAGADGAGPSKTGAQGAASQEVSA